MFAGFSGAGLGLAPFQCASAPSDEARRREDSAPEALYNLSQYFEQHEDLGARVETLRYLVERYPNSRYAARAKRELAEMTRSPDSITAHRSDSSRNAPQSEVELQNRVPQE